MCFGDKPKQGSIPGVHPFSPSRVGAHTSSHSGAARAQHGTSRHADACVRGIPSRID